MKIQDHEWNKCPTCKNNTSVKQREIYGCDHCGKEIDLNKKEEDYLEAVVFSHTEESVRKQYCTWACALKDLRKVKTDYFIDLPYLSFDKGGKGLKAKDFFKLMK